jgi:hypothetical protein
MFFFSSPFYALFPAHYVRPLERPVHIVMITHSFFTIVEDFFVLPTIMSDNPSIETKEKSNSNVLDQGLYGETGHCCILCGRGF